MPFGDMTGPWWGTGPMTGRAAGYCAGYPVPGFMNPLPGRGLGRGIGFGWGRGFGRGFRGGRGFGWRRWVWNYPVYQIQPSVPIQPAPIAPAQFQSFQPQITKGQEIQFLEQEVRALEQERKMIDQGLEDIRKRLKELRK